MMKLKFGVFEKVEQPIETYSLEMVGFRVFKPKTRPEPDVFNHFICSYFSPAMKHKGGVFDKVDQLYETCSLKTLLVRISLSK